MAVVKHIVLLKFKQGVTEAQVGAMFAELRDLQSVIPGYTEFIGGPYSSPEGLNQGYTHGFILTFGDAQARNTYLDHPEHERVKNKYFPLIDGVVAFDFEVP